jgi:N-acetylneuraminic acid mutarotase
LNTWTQKASFPGTARVLAAAFAINGKGYLGSGGFSPSSTTYYNDFWEYDPTLNSWTSKASFATLGRIAPVGFALNGKGYIGLGSRTTNKNDFWEYDPTLDTWVQKGNFPGVARNSAATFTIGSFAYVGGGYDGSNDKQDFWQWEPIADLWVQKANLGGGTRTSFVAFSINAKGYIALGRNNGSNSNTLWEYDPSFTTEIEEQQNFATQVYPNPARLNATIEFDNYSNKNHNLIIYNASGRIVRTISDISTGKVEIEKQDLASGLYFYQLRDEKQILGTGKIIFE